MALVLASQVAGELVEVGTGENRIGDVVEAPHRLFRVPAHAHLNPGVTGLEKTRELLLPRFVEALVGPGADVDVDDRGGPVLSVAFTASDERGFTRRGGAKIELCS